MVHLPPVHWYVMYEGKIIGMALVDLRTVERSLATGVTSS